MVNKSKKIRRQRSKDSLICFFICLLTSLFFCFLIPFPCFAHKPSDSYITLKRVNNEVVGKWDIALKDLEYALGLDDNSDGKITWGELRLHHNQIADYALVTLK